MSFPRARVLALHGYHGSAAMIRQQLSPLVAGLDDVLDIIAIDAPSLAAGGSGWWHAVDEPARAIGCFKDGRARAPRSSTRSRSSLAAATRSWPPTSRARSRPGFTHRRSSSTTAATRSRGATPCARSFARSSTQAARLTS